MVSSPSSSTGAAHDPVSVADAVAEANPIANSHLPNPKVNSTAKPDGILRKTSRYGPDGVTANSATKTKTRTRASPAASPTGRAAAANTAAEAPSPPAMTTRTLADLCRSSVRTGRVAAGATTAPPRSPPSPTKETLVASIPDDAPEASCVVEEARRQEEDKLRFRQKRDGRLHEQQQQQGEGEEKECRAHEGEAGRLPHGRRVSIAEPSPPTEETKNEQSGVVETELSFACMTPVEYEETLRLAKDTGMASDDGRSIERQAADDDDDDRKGVIKSDADGGKDSDGGRGGVSSGPEKNEDGGESTLKSDSSGNGDGSEREDEEEDEDDEENRGHDDLIMVELGLLELVDRDVDAECMLDAADVALEMAAFPSPEEGHEKDRLPRAFLLLWETLSGWITPRTHSLVQRWNGVRDREGAIAAHEDNATAARRAGVASMIRMHMDRSIAELMPRSTPTHRRRSRPLRKDIERRLADLVRTFDCSRPSPKEWKAATWRGMTTVLISVAFPEMTEADGGEEVEAEEKVAVETKPSSAIFLPPSVKSLGLTPEEYRYLARSAVTDLGTSSDSP